MTRYKFLLSSLLVAASLGVTCPATLLAMPANPQFHEVLQPDGQLIKVRQWGDEHAHGWESETGHTIIYDESLKGWAYAVHDHAGRVASSTTLVNPFSEPPSLASRRLLPLKSASLTPSKVMTRVVAQPTSPVTGTKSLPVMLVDFSDKSFTKSRDDFNNLLFGSTGYTMKNYYLENSLNQLTVSGGASGVYGPVTVSKPHDYYGKNDASGSDTYPGTLVYEAVSTAAASGFKFAPFVDQTKGCYVETVIISHQGTGEESGYNDNDIWSHSWDLNSANSYEKYKTGNGEFVTNEPCASGGFIKVNNYVIQPELADLKGTMVGVGVFAHEFGHALGLPDLYDTVGSSEGAGDWTIMASGSWLGATGIGETPAHLDAWSKLFLGWASPATVSGSMTGQTINASSGASPSFYQLGAGTATSGEFFLVENRQRMGFDKYLPGTGLLVWHIDGSMVASKFSTNDINSYPCTSTISGACSSQHYGVALVQADNALHLELGKNYGDSFDPFYLGNKASISDSTSPGMRFWSGTTSGFSIADISASSTTMTATFTGPTVFLNGTCGSSDGGIFTTTPTVGLCSAGTASTVSGSGPWAWTCQGSGGGTSASCSAQLKSPPVSGVCGPANNGSFNVAPTSGLCSVGTATTLAGTGPWYWTCLGSNGGDNTSCSASQKLSLTVTSGTVISSTYKGKKGTIGFTVAGTFTPSQLTAAMGTTSDWVTLGTVKTKGTTGTLAYSVLPNTGMSRSAEINLGNSVVTIQQDGAPCKITSAVITPSTLAAAGGEADLNVTVSPEACTWSVMAIKTGGEWLAGLVGASAVTGSGSIHGTAAKNSTGKTRSTAVSLITGDGKGKKTITVKQAGM